MHGETYLLRQGWTDLAIFCQLCLAWSGEGFDVDVFQIQALKPILEHYTRCHINEFFTWVHNENTQFVASLQCTYHLGRIPDATDSARNRYRLAEKQLVL